MLKRKGWNVVLVVKGVHGSENTLTEIIISQTD